MKSKMDINRIKRIENIKETISKITKILVGKDIRVTQKGSSAYVETDADGKPNVVNIPNISDNASDELLYAIQGFVDHQVSRVLFGDFKTAKKAKMISDDIEAIYSIIEDTYVERKMGNEFKGSKVNLEKTREFYLEKIIKPGVKNCITPQEKFGTLLSSYMRANAGQDVFGDYIKQEKFNDDPDLKPFLDKLPKDLKQALAAIESGQDCLDLALRIKEQFEEDFSDSSDQNSDSNKSKSKKSSKEKSSESDSKDDGSENSDEKNKDKDKKSSKDKKDKKKEQEDKESDGDEEDDEENESDGDEEDQEDETDEDGEDEAKDDGEDKDGKENEDEAEEDESDDGEGDGEDEFDDEEDENEEGESDSDDDGENENEGSSSPIDIKSFSSSISNDITKSLGHHMELMDLKEKKNEDYVVYTTEYDVIQEYIPYNDENAKALISKIDDKTMHVANAMQKNLERLIMAKRLSINVPGYRSGRLHSGSLHRLNVNDDRVFRRKHVNKEKNTAISLVIDQSGSMGGGTGSKAYLAMISAYAFAVVLERLGINYEAIGFTTLNEGSSYKKRLSDGLSFKDLQRSHSSEVYSAYSKHRMSYARYESIYMPIYKSFGEKLGVKAKSRFADAAINDHYHNNNVDGESILNAYKRLMKQPEERKIIMVLSDGSPAWDLRYTKDGYSSGVANRHLSSVVQMIENQPNAEIVGIGICDSNVKHFYKNNVVVSNIGDLPKVVIGKLKDFLLK